MSESNKSLPAETILKRMNVFLGEWEGPAETWFEPNTPVHPGYVKSKFTPLLGGLFIQEEYTGRVGSKDHAGIRILGVDQRLSQATCYWMDSFHTGSTAMVCAGEWVDDRLVVLGHYYGGDEKWGWRTEFQVQEAHVLSINQYNIFPSGEAALAVKSTLRRSGLG
ncbi:DUF1579 family protein [Oligoflexus tunisiensis]|uniref:DUF1579 family protein n=1 Tax=Oligoflexus tunisiensis TaxID=708132 RepID=UPI00159F3288|nr:DUF1579 family protein [Oligoflexus tunisiensis]